MQRGAAVLSLLEPFRMTRERWWAKVVGVQTAGTYRNTGRDLVFVRVALRLPLVRLAPTRVLSHRRTQLIDMACVDDGA